MKKFDSDEVQAIINWARQGASYHAIASELMCSTNRVRQICRAAGLPATDRLLGDDDEHILEWRAARARKMGEMRSRGMTFQQIGDKFSITKERASRILKNELRRLAPR